MKHPLTFFAGLVAAIALVGCGGNGSDTTATGSAFAGVYRGTYSRADGNIMVHVRDNGSATVRIFDGTNIVPWEVQTTVNADGNLSGTANNLSGTASFDLHLEGEGVDAQISGTATILGDPVTVTGGFVGTGDTSLFQGPFYGLLTPTVGDPFNMNFTVTEDGSFDISVVDETGSYSGTGTVDTLGKVSFTADGASAGSLGKTISGTGYVTFVGDGILGWGAYSATGGINGTWTVTNTPPDL